MGEQMKPFWFAGCTIAVISGLIAYLLADNQPPYVYDAEQSYVIPSHTSPGHQVAVHWSIKVNRLCPGSIVRTIVDARTGARTSYDPTPAILTIETTDTVLDRTFLLPQGMGLGRKIYRANAEYVCNPLQRIWPLKVQTPDLLFEVE
jgi:hypothetical protein